MSDGLREMQTFRIFAAGYSIRSMNRDFGYSNCKIASCRHSLRRLDSLFNFYPQLA